MKKILPFCLCVLLVIPSLATPVFAAEPESVVFEFELLPDIQMFGDDSFDFGFFEDELLFIPFSEFVVISEGSYHLWIDSSGVLIDLGIHKIEYSYGDEGVGLCVFDATAEYLPPLNITIAELHPDTGSSIVGISNSADGDILTFSDGTILRFQPVESSSPSSLLSVKESLSAVIEWVGSVTTSLLSGELEPLLPLLAIPIAISIVLFAIKAVKTLAWGS